MTKRKSISALFITLLLALTAVFVLTACEEVPAPPTEPTEPNYASLVAGTYTFSNFDTRGKHDYVFTVDNDGNYELNYSTVNGIVQEKSSLSGTITVDENKNVTALTVDDIFNFSGKNYIFGNLLPNNQDPYLMAEASLIVTLLEGHMQNIVKMEFEEDYVLLTISGDAQILYKADAEKFAYNTVLRFFTEKDTMTDSSYALEAMIMGIEMPTYDTDYYFFLDEYTFTKGEQNTDFLSDLEKRSAILLVDHVGTVDKNTPDIVEVSGFDFTTTGTKTGVIKYLIGTELKEQTVSYTVVEDERYLPRYQVLSISLTHLESTLFPVNYVEKGTDLYSLGWELSVETYSEYQEIPICEGFAEYIKISGYDATKTGYQLVTIKYEGKELSTAIFVYDETVNPVISAHLEGSLCINVSGDTRTLDCSGLKFITVLADGNTAEIPVTADMAVNGDLSGYEHGDAFYFVYEYEHNETTYFCYDYIYVNVRTDVE